MSEENRPEPMPLAPRELARWTWRQLTSMRTALLLLFLLALAAIPGSVIPQEAVDPVRAANWRQAHPGLADLYQRLGLFSVYDSAWFSAIYLLLVVSLVGCIVPRLRVYLRGVRAAPPRTPKNLSRLPEYRSYTTEAAPEEVLAAARARLRGYRLRAGEEEDGAISAERGYLREAGNLLFHLAVLVVLAGFAWGSLFGFRGGVIVVTGTGFADTLSQYDDFAPGKLFDPADLAPFNFTVTDFDVTFIRSGREAGGAHKFSAGLDYQVAPEAPTQHTRIEVNHPLTIDGTTIYLISHGYAPNVTVRDGTGAVAYSGPVVFLPEDASFRSFGVIKVPDAKPSQLGFEGELYPTYAFTDATGPFSAFPDAKNPVLSMLAYRGDLGLDNGVPQSVYALKKAGLKPIPRPDGRPFRVDLAMGKTVVLPDGLGSITFDSISRFVKLQISRSPGDWLALLGVVLALLGLIGSLYIRPRRIWIRVGEQDGRTLVEVAGLDRSSGGDLSSDLDTFVTRMQEKA